MPFLPFSHFSHNQTKSGKKKKTPNLVLQIAFLAVLALLSQPNQREKTQISFSKKQLNDYLPSFSTEFLATIQSKIPKTTPLNKNTHRIKKGNKRRARKNSNVFLFLSIFSDRQQS
jgi:hypothetical protein